MSKLILTEFLITVDVTKLENYEKNLAPKKGEKVFIFGGGKKETDDANISVVKKQLGYAKDMKFNAMTVSQIKNMNKGMINADKSFTALRYTELEDMYNKMANLFLSTYHNAYWNYYNNPSGRYVLSTIDLDEFYDLLLLGVDTFKTILIKNINDKYGEKYSNVEIDNTLERNRLEINEMVGKK